ncbi:DNA helicase [Tanacetum coccineum]
MITKSTYLGKFLADTDLIIWDEAPMNNRRCYEALDRSLKGILTTPHSLFEVFTLKENMRLARPNINADERNLVNSFASSLLDIGDGKAGQADDEDPKNTSWIDIPPNYCLPSVKMGNAIQANMSLKDVNYFNPKLQLGMAYRISNFICEATSRYQYGTNALSKFSPDTELVLHPLQDKLTSRDKSLDLSAFKLSHLLFSLLSLGSSSC